MQPSDPNFQQSADCRKLASPAPKKQFHGNGPSKKKVRSCSLLLRSSVFRQIMEKHVFFFLKKKFNFSEVAFSTSKNSGFCL